MGAIYRLTENEDRAIIWQADRQTDRQTDRQGESVLFCCV